MQFACSIFKDMYCTCLLLNFQGHILFEITLSKIHKRPKNNNKRGTAANMQIFMRGIVTNDFTNMSVQK